MRWFRCPGFAVTRGLLAAEIPISHIGLDEHRFGILRRVLHDQELDPRDRFAGSVLLLYGNPTTRTVALRTGDIRTTADGMITLRLGRGEIPLTEPLGIHQSRAAAWVRMAGGTYADYVSLRTHN